jgi:tetratricopeptide (TPR) repeat protein
VTQDLQPGSKIGRYVLDAFLGSGSFGVVWRGHAEGDDTPVAVKILSGGVAAEAGPVGAEVELLAAAAARRSEHVVKVLDGGAEPVPYIVMEYVQGEDLWALLRQKGRLSARETIGVGLAVADALRALYQAGIIHRDIKPANVMIDANGVIKLADFGIAQIVGYATAGAGDQTALTMAYAAPEIWQEGGKFGRISHRSDLYALGTLLYQCLAGITPFSGDYDSLLRAHREREPDVGVLPATTPASLRIMIVRCLAKMQDERPRDAAECIGLLKRAEVELDDADGEASSEPRRLGPWTRGSAHESVEWAWRCLDERSKASATVEVYFSDDLSMGERLARVVSASAGLVALGGERLLASNRLLLFPSESWREAPPGEFQFWLAREDQAVAPAALVTAPMLRVATLAIGRLLDAAAAAGLSLDFGRGNLTVTSSGEVYLRRPGLPRPGGGTAEPMPPNLLALPLDEEARLVLEAAPDFMALLERYRGEEQGTILAERTQVVATHDAQATVMVETLNRAEAPVALAAAAAAARPASAEAARPRPAGAPLTAATLPARGLRLPVLGIQLKPAQARAFLIGGGAGLTLLVLAALLVFGATGKGGSGPSMTAADTARAHLISYRFQEARAEFDKAIEQGPENAANYSGRGSANLYLGDLAAAAADADKALALDSASAEAHFVRGQVFDWQEHAEEAIAALSRAIELDPRMARYYAFRSLYIGDRDPEKRLADANKALELDQGSADAHRALGAVLREEERYAEAEAEYAKAVALDTENGLRYANQAAFFFAKRDYAQTLRLLDENRAVIASYPLSAAEGYWARGATYLRQGRYRESLTELTKAVELVPLAPAYFDWRGYCYYLLGDNNAAVADLDKAIELAPSFADAYYVRSLVRREQGQADAAFQDINRALALDPKDAVYHASLAALYWRQDDYPAAIEWASKAIALNPSLDEAYNIRSLARGELQQYNDAIADINKAIELDPESAQFLANRGSLHIDIKNYQAALNDLNAAVAKEPDNDGFYNLRGIAQHWLRNYDAAIGDFSRAIQNDGSNFRYYMNRGTVLEDARRNAEARADYERARSLAKTPAQTQEAQAALDSLGP